MAFWSRKFVLHFGREKCRSSLFHVAQNRPAINALQVAYLTSAQSHGYDIVRVKPWDYKKRPYRYSHQFLDHTMKRLNDNSKIIVVEGSVAAGKTEFAKKVAKEFDLLFMEDHQTTQLYFSNGFDKRKLNPQLPPTTRFLDTDVFFKHDGPQKMMKNIGRTQMHLYVHRFMQYVNALEHLLNTGQGVVLERSPFSDVLHADALRKFGYISAPALKHYNLTVRNTLCELWKPHLVVYLDGTLSETRDRIKKRNKPSEVNSPVLTDDYLQALSDIYSKKIIPKHRVSSEILTYDIADMPDWEMIVEDLETIQLDSPTEDNEKLFADWQRTTEEAWNMYRQYVSNKKLIELTFRELPTPWDAPELVYVEEDFDALSNIVHKHPAVKFAAGYNSPDKNYLLNW